MTNNQVQQIIRDKDLATIIQAAGIELRPAGGGRLKGLCPFHSEKTASFIVFRDTQRFHCFGCGVGGDLIDFVMQRRGLSFPEALETLSVDDWRPSSAKLKKIKDDQRKRRALKWRERDLSWTIAKAIRIAEKTLSDNFRF